MIKESTLVALVALCCFNGSCVGHSTQKNVWPTTLEEDMQSAKPIMYEFNLKKMADLQKRLHQRLIEEGDEKFAGVLEQQSDEVRTEVCNAMGLLEDKKFDEYPKTRYQLSAAPKI